MRVFAIPAGMHVVSVKSRGRSRMCHSHIFEIFELHVKYSSLQNVSKIMLGLIDTVVTNTDSV